MLYVSWRNDYRINDANPVSVTAKLKISGYTYIDEYGNYHDPYYYIDLTWQNISPNTILVY